jgi:hypothetical protein
VFVGWVIVNADGTIVRRHGRGTARGSRVYQSEALARAALRHWGSTGQRPVEAWVEV